MGPFMGTNVVHFKDKLFSMKTDKMIISSLSKL